MPLQLSLSGQAVSTSQHASEATQQEQQPNTDSPQPDKMARRRVHAWVLVLPGKREVRTGAAGRAGALCCLVAARFARQPQPGART